jgi:hypothetical protein
MVIGVIVTMAKGRSSHGKIDILEMSSLQHPGILDDRATEEEHKKPARHALNDDYLFESTYERLEFLKIIFKLIKNVTYLRRNPIFLDINCSFKHVQIRTSGCPQSVHLKSNGQVLLRFQQLMLMLNAT